MVKKKLTLTGAGYGLAESNKETRNKLAVAGWLFDDFMVTSAFW